MKKYIFILLFFLPLISIAQDGRPKHDTLILDRFFQFVGKQCKKVFAIKPVDSSKLYPNRLRPGMSFSYLSVGTKFNKDNYDFEQFFNPSLTIQYRKSTFVAGLRFYWGGFDFFDLEKPGLILSYQFMPFSKRRILNFFFHYQIGFFNEKGVFRYPYNLGSICAIYYPVTFPKRYTYTWLDNHIGYGIKLSLTKYAYLFHMTGLGFSWEKTKYRDYIPNSSSNIHSDTWLTGDFSLGLGFRFRK